MSASTSRRSALPKRRRRSSISMATSRSSASSSSRARSALRVTRKAWWCADRHAGEERVEVGGDDLLERHEALAVGHDDEAGQRRRHLDPGDAPLARRRVLHLDHQVEREVRDVGERVAGVDGQRGEHGEDLALEDLDEVRRGRRRRARTSPTKRTPASARPGTMRSKKMWSWRRDQLLDPGPDHRQLLARPQAVDRAGAHAGGDLVLQRGHPDLVELVEQLGEDGEELGPLEQREPVVLGQVEQAGAEVEPRLLPVGEALVAERLDLLVGRRGRVLDVGRGARAASARPAGARTWGAGCAGGWC